MKVVQVSKNSDAFQRRPASEMRERELTHSYFGLLMSHLHIGPSAEHRGCTSFKALPGLRRLPSFINNYNNHIPSVIYR
jgi:hypothetical protein